MATIDQVKKMYDRLTPHERYALIVAAGRRGDDKEQQALKSAAPRKIWSMPDHHGLAEGFNFVSMWYAMEQQGYFVSLYFMQSGTTPGNDGNQYVHLKKDGKELVIDFNDYGNKLIRRVLTNYAAWLKLCDEYKIDEADILKGLPHYEVMQLMIAILEGAAAMIGEEAQPVEAEIQADYEDMRAVIEKFYKDWS